VGGIAIGHALEDVGEVTFGLSAVELGGLDERVDASPAAGTPITFCKQVILAAKDRMARSTGLVSSSIRPF